MGIPKGNFIVRRTCQNSRLKKKCPWCPGFPYLPCILCYSGDLQTTLLRVELNFTVRNFQKSAVNTYTWNFGKCDTP